MFEVYSVGRAKLKKTKLVLFENFDPGAPTLDQIEDMRLTMEKEDRRNDWLDERETLSSNLEFGLNHDLNLNLN
ncbi:hypothetical protein C2S52_019732 [Perilla frutescens var. hirtella]|nr:hypothetical protein C2S52_019732 [Perilla frutescens var. hirtella]